MLRNPKLPAWRLLLAQDDSLVAFIFLCQTVFLRQYTCDGDRQRDILEIKPIFTIDVTLKGLAVQEEL